MIQTICRKVAISIRNYLNSLNSLVSAEIFAWIRIGIGLCLFLYNLQASSTFLDIFSPTRLGEFSLLSFSTATAHTLTIILRQAHLIFSLFVMFGFRTQVSIVILFLLQSILISLNPFAFWGWGLMSRNFLFFLFFTNSGEILSIDSKNKSGSSTTKNRPLWMLKLFQWQIILIYLIASLYRIDNEAWRNGRALGFALGDGIFARFPGFDWISLGEKYLWPFSYFGFLLEILAPFALLWNSSARATALLLIFLHITLEATAFVQYWQHFMILGLFSFFARQGQSSPAPIKSSLSTPLIICIGFILIFIHAFPRKLAPHALGKFFDIVSLPVSASTIVATKYMNMFENPIPWGRICFLGMAKRNHLDTKLNSGNYFVVYSSDISYCLESKIRFFHDEMTTTLYRIYQRGLKANDISAAYRIQRFLCSKIAPITNAEDSVFFFIARERYSIDSNGERRTNAKLQLLLDRPCNSNLNTTLNPLDLKKISSALPAWTKHFGPAVLPQSEYFNIQPNNNL